MPYSQKSLVELMKVGAFPGETTVIRHIETVMSYVFIFDSTVYKFYKNDNDFFNKAFRDLSGKEGRFSFTRRDFAWNQSLSPSIYLRLVGVTVAKGEIQVGSPGDNAEELVIVMNRVNTHDILFEKLMRGAISSEDSFEIGRQLGESLKKVQVSLSGHNFYDLFRSRIADLRQWTTSASEYLPEEEAKAYCGFLEGFRNNNRERFEGELSSQVVVDGDFHSHNAVFSDGSLHLMDTFAPKDEWGVGHVPMPPYRIGVDIWALSGDKHLFENFVKGYEAGSGTAVDRTLEDLYIVYASNIMVVYLYMLQRTDPGKKEAAERFHTFLRNYFAHMQ